MDYIDLKKYLEGKTNPEETERAKSWIIDKANDTELRQLLGEIWANTEFGVKGQLPNFEQMLDRIHYQIDNEQLIVPSRKKTLLSEFYQLFSRAAAILVIPLILLSAYLYFNPTVGYNEHDNKQIATRKPIAVREIYTKPGTRINIELADGSRVWLNDGTTFRYPEEFTGNTREVFVDGEAYFEVKKDSACPFVVNNPIMATIVTGTHFNLHAYSSDRYFEATLQEGKINLEHKGRHINVLPGEQVQFDSDLNKLTQKEVNPQYASAWVDGKLIFKDEKLGTAIKKIARWYNVEITLKDNELKDYLLTATFEQEKLDQTMRLISLALPIYFEYKKVDNPTEIQREIIIMKRN